MYRITLNCRFPSGSYLTARTNTTAYTALRSTILRTFIGVITAFYTCRYTPLAYRPNW